MNIEEKAKQYAESVVDVDTFLLCLGKGICDDHIEYASQCFTAGYTQAVTDLNAENEKLRVVLREIVKYTDEMQIAKTDYDYNISSAERKATIIKAKQLITE